MMTIGMKFYNIDDVDVDGNEKLHWWVEARMMLLFKGQMMIAAWYGVVAAKSNIK